MVCAIEQQIEALLKVSLGVGIFLGIMFSQLLLKVTPAQKNPSTREH